MSYSSNFSGIKSNLLKFKNKRTEGAKGPRIGNEHNYTLTAMTFRQSTKTPTKFNASNNGRVPRTALISLNSYTKRADRSNMTSTDKRKEFGMQSKMYKY